MAGLNDLLADKETTSTQLPDWYNAAAQQSLLGAQQAFNQVPGAAQTVGQQAVNQISGAANPFGQAQDALSHIASGAANPWMTSSEGQLTPDTSTNMGALFQSQRDYLQRMLPEIQAQPDAASIGSGNFGSLRGQTARDTALGNAISKMNSDQFQAAQQAQTQGVQAGSALANTGNLYGDTALKLAQFQQTAPFSGVLSYNKALGGIDLPKTTSKQMQYSPLGQADAIGKFIGSAGASSFLDKFGITGANAGEKAANIISKLTGGALGNSAATLGGGALPAGAVRLPSGAIQWPSGEQGGSITRMNDGSLNVLHGDGTTEMFDARGNSLGNLASDADIYGTPSYDLGGGDTSWIDDTNWSQYSGSSEE